MRLFGLLSISTGIVYGALSFVSLYRGFLLPGIHAAGMSSTAATISTALGAAGACFPAVATAIAMSAILYNISSDFIKNDRMSGINTFFRHTWVLPFKAWRNEEITDRTLIIKAVAFACCKTLLASVAVLSTLIISTAMFGVFQTSCMNMLGGFLNGKATARIGYAAAGTNAAASLPFAADSNFSIMSSLTSHMNKTFCKETTTESKQDEDTEKTKSTGSFISLPWQSAFSRKQSTLNVFQKALAQKRFIHNMLRWVSVVLNGAGQATLATTDTCFVKDACQAAHIGPATKPSAAIATAVYSMEPNNKALMQIDSQTLEVGTINTSESTDSIERRSNSGNTSQTHPRKAYYSFISAFTKAKPQAANEMSLR